MESQNKAEVVPLFGELEDITTRAEEPASPAPVIEWTELRDPQPGAYRRMLEILFAPHVDDEAA